MKVLRSIRRTWRKTVEDRWLRNYLFVHINKTGGSSVERALGLHFRHATALEQRRALGERTWCAKFTFAFVRNPWDRTVSQYHYRRDRDKTGLRTQRVEFSDWVRLVFEKRDPRYLDDPKMFLPQEEWIADGDGKILVDYVGRYESLEEDFREICRRIGKEAALPHVKASERGSYRGYYDARTAESVRRWYAKDCERFGYRF